MSKIVFLEAVQSFGGARKSTLELCKRLSSTYDVSIWDLNGACLPFVEACKKEGVSLTILDKQKDTFIINDNSIIKQIFKKIHFLIYAIKINKKIRKMIGGESCYFVVNNSKVLTFLIRKPKNMKCILFARGWYLPQQISRVDKILYKKLIDKFVGVSEATRHAMYCAKLSTLTNIYVVHNAIKEEDVMTNNQPIARTHSLQILFCGGFLPTKGQQVALKIAKKLLDFGLDFKIVLCGIVYKGDTSQKWLRYVKNTISSCHLENHIEVVENHHNVINYFHWCDIFCHPSDTEGLPRVVMEAMLLKKPVVANAVGGVTDYVLNGFTGLLTRHNHVDDYVNAILKLDEDHEFRNRITENAFHLVKRTFTESRQMEDMKKVLD